MDKNSIRATNYNIIDLMKLFMAICVVAIHTHPLENVKNEVLTALHQNIINLAVPFFFIASGFFLQIKLEKAKDQLEVIRGFVRKSIRLYVCANIIYIPIIIQNLIREQHPIYKTVYYIFRGFTLLGGLYLSGHLWFVLSSIYVGIFLYLMVKRNLSLEKIVFMGLIIMSMGELVYYILTIESTGINIITFLQKLIRVTIMRGRVARGFLYIPLGMLFAKKSMPFKPALFVFLVGFFGCLMVNANVLQYMIAIAAVGLFNAVIHIQLPNASVYKYCREMSIGIYVVHNLVSYIYYMCVYGQVRYGFDCFLVTMLGSVLLSLGFMVFKSKQKQLRCSTKTET